MGKLVGIHMHEKIDNAHSLGSVTSQVVQIVQEFEPVLKCAATASEITLSAWQRVHYA